jgi:DNA-binding CsgD family transcriptional regulator
VAIETTPTLLERDRELTALGDVLTGARQGRGRIVLVGAPAGLGKTSLLRAASNTAAEAGFTTLRARASELEQDFAYGCVRQLLEPLVVNATDTERRRLFGGAGALSRPLFEPSATPLTSPAADTSFSMLHGLYWLLENLAAQGPVALSVDDLHWADTESLRFLNYLAPRVDGLAAAVLTSARSGETTPDLARLAAVPETTVLRPRPLSIEATATLCQRRLGGGVASEFAEACRDATGGNPFFLEALLREAGEQEFSADARGAERVRGLGPAAVAHAVLLRLSDRPAAATAVVRAVAVLGDGAGLADVARLAELPEDETAQAADLLIALAILERGEGLGFAHPIVREAVYSDIGLLERAEAHARAAAMLAASGGSEERIAAQITAAEPRGDAARVELLRRVAADALARGAPAAAVAWLGRALAEPPPAECELDVLLELGSAELRSAAPGAIDHLQAAVSMIREPGRLTNAVRQLALALTMAGQADRAVEALESTIEAVEPANRELALVLEAELATYAQQASREARAPAARRLERRGALEGATPGERLVLGSLAFERARASESASEAAGHIERAVADGRLLGDKDLDVAGLLYDLMTGLLATDALDAADDFLDQMLADARARASIPALAFVTCYRGRCAMRRGVVARAETEARTSLELLTSHDIELGARIALGLLIEALTEAGELEAAEGALRDAAVGEDIPPGLSTNYLLGARGLLRLAQSRAEAALEDLVEFGRRDELWGLANPLASRWRSRAALALAAMRQGERARRMSADDLARARRWGAPSGIGIALRAAALVEGGAGMVGRLREAADVLAQSPARLEHARALTELGGALRRANRRAEARGPLGEGLDLAQRCGARALAEHARAELLAAGGRSADPEGDGMAELTASERRVAELAAEGHSNPEIAQALFVTRKTVETHLGRVYRKLDISGRGELGRVFGEPPRAYAGTQDRGPGSGSSPTR